MRCGTNLEPSGGSRLYEVLPGVAPPHLVDLEVSAAHPLLRADSYVRHKDKRVGTNTSFPHRQDLKQGRIESGDHVRVCHLVVESCVCDFVVAGVIHLVPRHRVVLVPRLQLGKCDHLLAVAVKNLSRVGNPPLDQIPGGSGDPLNNDQRRIVTVQDCGRKGDGCPTFVLSTPHVKKGLVACATISSLLL